ncbi:hypothetical protein HYW72_01905 [Candidatus Nomurabacteria bacterium]|nr:hypothetical protein [Candidatus Nomurabacteria bacterium]
MRYNVEGQPSEKEIVKKRLLKIKRESLDVDKDNIQPIIKDLEWYLDLKRKEKVNLHIPINDLDLWNTMSVVYKDFNEEELEDLINHLKGANN